MQKQKTTLDQRQLESGQPGSNASPTSAPPTKPPTAKKRRFAGAIAQLLLVGIASPFLEVWEGGPSFGWAIGIVILIVGIRIAWRLTAARPLAVYGPFNNSTPPAP